MNSILNFSFYKKSGIHEKDGEMASLYKAAIKMSVLQKKTVLKTELNFFTTLSLFFSLQG